MKAQNTNSRTIYGNGVQYDINGQVVIESTNTILVPKGTEAERPTSPNNGQIRYNTDDDQFEGYQNFINDPNLTDVFTLDRAWPVNINNDGKIDFIATDLEVGSDDRFKKQTLVFYSIISK